MTSLVGQYGPLSLPLLVVLVWKLAALLVTRANVRDITRLFDKVDDGFDRYGKVTVGRMSFELTTARRPPERDDLPPPVDLETRTDPGVL
jgi:hypothetical protein